MKPKSQAPYIIGAVILTAVIVGAVALSSAPAPSKGGTLPPQGSPPQGGGPITPVPADPVPPPEPAPPPADLEPGPAPAVPVPAPLSAWGKVPLEWRQHFLALETIAGVPGSAKLLAILGWSGSRYDQFKHDQSQAARDLSTAAYDGQKPARPLLKYGDEARVWGTGGLFDMTAPDVLWSGSRELGSKAPMLTFVPQIAGTINAANFAAAVRLRDIQQLMLPTDGLLEYAAAMMSPYLFAKDRNSAEVTALKQKFQQAAAELGIDLALLPQRYEASGVWMGVMAAYTASVKLGYPVKPDLGKLGGS